MLVVRRNAGLSFMRLWIVTLTLLRVSAVFDLIAPPNAQVVTGKGSTSDSFARQKVSEAYGLLVECLGILGLVPPNFANHCPGEGYCR